MRYFLWQLGIPGKPFRGNRIFTLLIIQVADLVGDLRVSARQPGVNGSTHVMKKTSRFVRYSGLALEWGANALKCAYYALKFLGEVTNYRAQSLRSPLHA